MKSRALFRAGCSDLVDARLAGIDDERSIILMCESGNCALVNEYISSEGARFHGRYDSMARALAGDCEHELLPDARSAVNSLIIPLIRGGCVSELLRLQTRVESLELGTFESLWHVLFSGETCKTINFVHAAARRADGGRTLEWLSRALAQRSGLDGTTVRRQISASVLACIHIGASGDALNWTKGSARSLLELEKLEQEDEDRGVFGVVTDKAHKYFGSEIFRTHSREAYLFFHMEMEQGGWIRSWAMEQKCLPCLRNVGLVAMQRSLLRLRSESSPWPKDGMLLIEECLVDQVVDYVKGDSRAGFIVRNRLESAVEQSVWASLGCFARVHKSFAKSQFADRMRELYFHENRPVAFRMLVACARLRLIRAVSWLLRVCGAALLLVSKAEQHKLAHAAVLCRFPPLMRHLKSKGLRFDGVPLGAAMRLRRENPKLADALGLPKDTGGHRRDIIVSSLGPLPLP
jgi:hypothetical protein